MTLLSFLFLLEISLSNIIFMVGRNSSTLTDFSRSRRIYKNYEILTKIFLMISVINLIHSGLYILLNRQMYTDYV
jgi:hypothetical protein